MPHNAEVLEDNVLNTPAWEAYKDHHPCTRIPILGDGNENVSSTHTQNSENVPHGLRCEHLVPVGGAGWIGLGGTGLLERGVLLGIALGFLCFLLALFLLPGLPPAATISYHDGLPPSGTLSFYVLPSSWCLPQQQKVTKTDGIQHMVPKTACLEHNLFLRRKKIKFILNTHAQMNPQINYLNTVFKYCEKNVKQNNEYQKRSCCVLTQACNPNT